jgi:carbamoyl-phosphate synthase large subunit
MCVLTDFFLPRMQTALLFAQCMNAKLPRQEGIPPEVKSWSEFCGGKMM